MRWLLNAIYVLAITAALPLLLYRRLVHGKYRDGWKEKLFGSVPLRRGNQPCLWLHAVSVGEVLQLKTILPTVRGEHPDVEFVISTTSSTGQAVARRTFPGEHVCYFPFDFSWAVQRAIHRIRPSAIVLVELELWPNFIVEANRAGVPLGLINGRISARSYRGYLRIRPLMKRILPRIRYFAVQSDSYAERLIHLGAPRERVSVTGSVKFDCVESNRRNPRTEELRKSFGIADEETVFIAGSTQAPEEQYAIATWLALRDEFPDLRLILVPRHQERFDEVAELVARHGLPPVRRSRFLNETDASAKHRSAEVRRDPQPKPEDRSVLLLDTLGELCACWGLADIAFVGGSLTNRGGQNMIEPAAYGSAVLFGPNTRNFQDVVDMLLAHGAARTVHNDAELTAVVRDLLEHREIATRQGQTAQRLVAEQQGATERTAAIVGWLIEQNFTSVSSAA
jgi:3-deoxy-D-manno-octulosonic-acid transferase